MKSNFRRKVCQSLAAFVGGSLLASALWAGPPKPGADFTEKVVAQIRACVQSTDNDAKSSRKVERDLVGYSTEGGVLTGLFKGDAIVRMTARYFGESGKATEEYYLQNGSLVFLLCTRFNYDNLKNQKVVSQTQTRYYWNNAGKLIRMIDNDKTLAVAAGQSGPEPTPRDYARDAQTDCVKFAKMLRAPGKNKAGDDPR